MRSVELDVEDRPNVSQTQILIDHRKRLRWLRQKIKSSRTVEKKKKKQRADQRNCTKKKEEN